MKKRFASITATGSYLPEIRVPNDELRDRFAHLPSFVDKMEASTGIRCRYYAPPEWAASDLAAPAARQALERANKRPEDVDLIILGTDSPDYITPATSVVLQHKIGARNAGTFDVGCACASFPTGLATAAGLMATNAALRTVLVVGVYQMHKLADPADPMIFFYGDGAGAAVLEAREQPGFINAAFQADGAYAKHWGIYSGGTAEPASVESIAAGRTNVRLVERYPPEINHDGWPRLVRRLAAEAASPCTRSTSSSSPRCANPPSRRSWPISISRSRGRTPSWRTGATPARRVSPWRSTTRSRRARSGRARGW